MDLHFPDKGRSVERLHARELAREARAARIKRDRESNGARIREGMRDSGIGGVHRTGREQLADIGREKESDADRYGEYEDA